MDMNLDIKLNQSKVDPNHVFIKTTGAPKPLMVSFLGQILANQYLGKDLSIKKWLKGHHEITLTYHQGPLAGKPSSPISYRVFSKQLRENKLFEPEALGIHDHHCEWMDGSMEFSLSYHMFDHTGVLAVQSGDLQKYYGNNYPLKPTLQREGRLYTSYQPQLIKRIARDRMNLIENSSQSLNDDWIFDLRNLISNVISLVEVALTQLYIKAEYDPLPKWNFSKDDLGPRHGRKMSDKLNWIHKISGKHLGTEKERPSFENLRELRNHLMHFDPPSLVITIEEATIWLNQIIDVAVMLIKMRQTIGVNVSRDLINLAMQPEAVFVPALDGERKSLEETKRENYASSTWPRN